MKSGKGIAADIDAYIAEFPPEVRKVLQEVRLTIRKSAPEAEETIKYGIPTYVLKGNLVHFGGFQKHIGFYATPSGNEAFKKELSAYPVAKGSIQFPLDKPIPFDLIAKMVKYRVKENLERAKAKKAKK